MYLCRWLFIRFHYVIFAKKQDLKQTLAIATNGLMPWCTQLANKACTQNHIQLRLLLRSDFGLLLLRGHNLTPVWRNLSNNHWVQLNCWNRPSVKTISKLPRVECMQMHFSYLNGKTSLVQMNPLSDMMLLWLCMQVYVYYTK